MEVNGILWADVMQHEYVLTVRAGLSVGIDAVLRRQVKGAEESFILSDDLR